MYKRVRYIGSKKGNNNRNVEKLLKDNVYSVNRIIHTKDRIKYGFVEVEGLFDAVLFEDINESDEVFLAYGEEIPVIGKCYNCYRVQNDYAPLFYPYKTKAIRFVLKISRNIYKVETDNGFFILQVK